MEGVERLRREEKAYEEEGKRKHQLLFPLPLGGSLRCWMAMRYEDGNSYVTEINARSELSYLQGKQSTFLSRTHQLRIWCLSAFSIFGRIFGRTLTGISYTLCT